MTDLVGEKMYNPKNNSGEFQESKTVILKSVSVCYSNQN